MVNTVLAPDRRKKVKMAPSVPFYPPDQLVTAVTLPYFADATGRHGGQPLDPMRHSSEKLASIFHTVGPRETAAMWQQNPRPAEGALFDRAFFDNRRIALEDLPQGLRWCRFWDYAYTEAQTNKGDPDYSVGAKMAFLFSEDYSTFTIFLSSIIRVRKDWSEVKRLIVQTAEMDGTECQIGGEANGPQKAASDDVLKLPALANYTFLPIGLVPDSVSSCQPWMDRARVQMMYIVEAEWNEPFFDECEVFPNGTHDDIPRAVAGAYYMCGIRAQSFDVAVRKQEIFRRRG